jgi:hypothetical protein
MTSSGKAQLDSLARGAKRDRRAPPGMVCEVCQRPLRVYGPGTRPLCYKHCRGPGKEFEEDHPAGRRNVPDWTEKLEANAHRDVTEFRQAAGMDEWPVANGDPLIALARICGGLATLLWAMACWLLELAPWLADRLGVDWHTGAPVFPFAL